jgi:hypothetical protein
MIANWSEKRVGRHRQRRKKNVGELPHIDSRPAASASRDSR